MYVDNFFSDLAEGHKGEELVLSILRNKTNDYTFENVAQERKYFNKGDIIAKKDGKETFLEVKTDSRISETQNVLCEESVHFFEGNRYVKGNMYSNYEIYCVLSKVEKKIYIIDFKVLKAIYKNYQSKTIEHRQQASIAYLVPLEDIKKNNGLITVISW